MAFHIISLPVSCVYLTVVTRYKETDTQTNLCVIKYVQWKFDSFSSDQNIINTYNPTYVGMCILDLVTHSKIETFMIKEIEKKLLVKRKMKQQE